MTIQCHQHALDEADKHHNLCAKRNNGSPVKQTREPSAESTALVLLNTSGTARAAEHAARAVDDEDPFQGPNIATPSI
jgi:hypothetical protein